jgi:hypothetical protein
MKVLPWVKFSRQQTQCTKHSPELLHNVQELLLYELHTCCGNCNSVILVVNSKETIIKVKEFGAKCSGKCHRKLPTDRFRPKCNFGVYKWVASIRFLWINLVDWFFSCNDAVSTAATMFRTTWESGHEWWADKDLKGHNRSSFKKVPSLFTRLFFRYTRLV